MTKKLTKSEKIFKSLYIAFLCVCFALLIVGVVYSFKPAKAETRAQEIVPPKGIPADYPLLLLTQPFVKSFDLSDTKLDFITTEPVADRQTKIVRFMFFFKEPVSSVTLTRNGVSIAMQINSNGLVARSIDLSATDDLTDLFYRVTTAEGTSPSFFAVYEQKDVYIYDPYYSYYSVEPVLFQAFETINKTLQAQWIKGYNDGFEVGSASITGPGYDLGYDKGYNEGYQYGIDQGESEGEKRGYVAGYDQGYDVGYIAGQQSNTTFGSEIAAVATAPIKMLQSMLNFEVMDTNLSDLIMGVLSAILVIKVVTFFV